MTHCKKKLSWWVLQLDQEGTVFYSTAPKWIKLVQREFPGDGNWCDHWKQCVWFVPGKGLSVSKGEDIYFLASHSDISVSYSLRVESEGTKNEHSVRKDDIELALSPEKIATYSDDNWRHCVLVAVKNAVRLVCFFCVLTVLWVHPITFYFNCSLRMLTFSINHMMTCHDGALP